MKKIFYILLGSPLLFSQVDLLAQSFVNGGNNLSAIGRVGTTSNQSFAFITGNIERARITNSGKFGIGTRTPVTGFHVNGVSSFGKNVTPSNATRVLNLADDNAVMRILRVHPRFAPAFELISRTSADGANVAYWDFYTEPSDASFRIRDRIGGVNRDRITISGDGHVGIGTTSPSAKLEVITPAEEYYNTGITSRGGYYGVESHGSEYGVLGTGSFIGVRGSGTAIGTFGFSDGEAGVGVSGESAYGLGVRGSSGESYGGNFESTAGTGLRAITEHGTYAAEFIGNTYTSGTVYQSSDKNLKTNIQEFGDALSIINKLKPQNYEFKNEAKYASLHLPKGRHY